MRWPSLAAAFAGTGTMRQTGISGERQATLSPDTVKNSIRLTPLANTNRRKAGSYSCCVKVKPNRPSNAATARTGSRMRATVPATAAMMRRE